MLLDQVTKGMATAHLQYGIPWPVIPGFNLTLLHNTGAAFSLLDDAAGWQRWMFTGIALVVSVIIVFWMRQLEARDRLALAALALILGGALGNVIDRLRLGYVVDFIQWYYQQWSWPAFNIADSAIFVGVIVLIFRKPSAES